MCSSFSAHLQHTQGKYEHLLFQKHLWTNPSSNYQTNSELSIPEKTSKAVVGGFLLHGYPMSVIAGAELLEGSEELRQQTQGHHHRPDEKHTETKLSNIFLREAQPSSAVSDSTSYLWWSHRWLARFSRQPSMKRMRICRSVNQQTREHNSFSASLIKPSDRWI